MEVRGKAASYPGPRSSGAARGQNDIFRNSAVVETANSAALSDFGVNAAAWDSRNRRSFSKRQLIGRNVWLICINGDFRQLPATFLVSGILGIAKIVVGRTWPDITETITHQTACYPFQTLLNTKRQTPPKRTSPSHRSMRLFTLSLFTLTFPDDQVDTSKLQQPIEPKRYFGKFVALE